MNYQDNFEKKTYFSIDYADLDDILQAEYDCPNYTSVLGQSNDSTIDLTIDGHFDNWDELRLLEFLKDRDQSEDSTTRLLLNDLCRKGMIEPGNYLIQICW